MGKFGTYPEETAPSNDDLVIIKENTGGANKRVQLQNILPAGSVGPSDIATNGVAAANLATNAITLGYAQITSTFSTTSASAVQVTGLSCSVTVPAGGRRLKITVFARTVSKATVFTGVTVWDGTVGSGTKLTGGFNIIGESAMVVMACPTPSAGAKTYNIGLEAGGGGTANLTATAAEPSFILVEVI